MCVCLFVCMCVCGCVDVHVQCSVERVIHVCVFMIRAGEHVQSDKQQKVHAESGSGGL